MRVFRLSDGSSWLATLHEPGDTGAGGTRAGWETVLFQQDQQVTGQRLVYRPSGWLDGATLNDLVAAYEEGVPVRMRWGG